MAGSSWFDMEALYRLNRIGGPNLTVRMIDAFLDSAPQRLARARTALADGDLEELKAVLHSLISSAGQLGATELERLATEGRSAMQEDESATAVSVLESIEAEFARVQTRLQGVRRDLEP